MMALATSTPAAAKMMMPISQRSLPKLLVLWHAHLQSQAGAGGFEDSPSPRIPLSFGVFIVCSSGVLV